MVAHLLLAGLLACGFRLVGQPLQLKVGNRLLPVEFHDTLRLDPYSPSVRLDFGYAQARIQNREAWDATQQRDRSPWRVDLIYSRYPRDTAQWITPYGRLMARRIDSLVALDPRLGGASIQWRLVAHGTCTSDSCARRLFHGAVVYYDPLPTLADDVVDPLNGRIDWPRLIEYQMGRVRAWAGGRAPLPDSLIFRTLDRRPEWGRLLVVLDWTSSMYPFGAQALRWVALEANAGRIAGLVAFNDGDDLRRPNQPKPTGRAGGIYRLRLDDPERLLAGLEAVMAAGDGGDLQENDIEALLAAQQLLPDSAYESLVLVADNGAGIRDAALMHKIKRPVHVILCRTAGRAIHPDYLTLAWHTRGSLTTLDTALDWSQNRPAAATRQWSVEGTRYRIDEEGRFRWIEVPKGW